MGCVIASHDSRVLEVVASSDSAPTLASRRVWTRLAANKPPLLLAGLVLALLAANVAWLLVNRHGGAMDIDEAGYQSISITDYNALRHGGLTGLVTAVNSQPTQAPLVPLLSSFAYLVVGRPSFVGAFAVQLLAYLIIIVATYSIGSMLANRWAGLVSALAVASLPIMVDYTHDYSFAVPAAAAATVAIWAALRSDRMRLKRFTLIWGIAIGAMVITRTMTIALVPSFALLAALHVIGSPRPKRSLIGVVLGLGAAAAVAGPWYSAQGASVWRYLTSFAYGPASAQQGVARSLLSPSSWLRSAAWEVNSHVYLPLAVVLVVGVVALATAFMTRVVRHQLPSLRTVVGSPWIYLAVIVAGGVLALQSTRNGGSGFSGPILPAMLVLAVSAIATVRSGRRVYECVALGAVVVLCLPSLITKTGFNTATGQPVSLGLPGLGSFKVIDARDNYLAYASRMGELDLGDSRGFKWRRTNDELLSALDDVVGTAAQLPVVFSFAHSLVNTNTLLWEELMFHGVSPAIYLLTPPGKGTNGYSAQLEAMLGSGRGVVLVSTDPRGMFPPILDQAGVRAAAARAGLGLARTVPLPDGADIEIWVR
jgi:4-amino-4-deoxy-L-arabinose transferase-like glycosyltransferase